MFQNRLSFDFCCPNAPQLTLLTLSMASLYPSRTTVKTLRLLCLLTCLGQNITRKSPPKLTASSTYYVDLSVRTSLFCVSINYILHLSSHTSSTVPLFGALISSKIFKIWKVSSYRPPNTSLVILPLITKKDSYHLNYYPLCTNWN